MIQATSISRLREFLDQAILNGSSIGFVPTMGALHEGHISLITRAKSENDLVVCSIFVNPTQFNDSKDLLNYPRTPEADYEILEMAGCDVVFTPSVDEMYPSKELIEMEFGDLETVMEGQYRPGHFKGVATIVSRFFRIINPSAAYFGEKDFQQLAIIREMNKRLNTGIEIVGCPTLRYEDGLAMSSRNIHLTAEERKSAPVIYQSLVQATESIKFSDPTTVKQQVIARIEEQAGFKVQYLELVDSESLQPISQWNPEKEQRACIAVLTSKTRLIDNVPL